ncbi:hypothetical protein M422DRAFT_47621 [Sphaerobolus stellatus SS14]|uniref:SRR1-like domain-containing protein n=1 Tax=Sphaerobolus stellatus (strain SS14) TaxID=990650 RepID=A0A0C9VZW9_SPHS4|nr:hypothetical protein M422DRAFT_47621 [Sphaerobolus stellatus SS14]
MGSLNAMRWLPSELQVLCLGLGSPMESKSSVAQLVLLLSVCDALKIAHEKVTLFDPQFSQEDIQGLLDMGFNVPTENKRGSYTLEDRTLVFMPHCGTQLYENLFRANWTPNRLQRLLLFGNVLEEYATSTPAWKLEQDTPCLSRICEPRGSLFLAMTDYRHRFPFELPGKHLQSDAVSSVEAYPSTFNNLALQFLNMDSFPREDPLIWQIPSRSQRQSEEIT